MEKTGKLMLTSTLFIRIIGALLGSLGFFLTAFNKTVVGAALVGLGGVLLALAEKLEG